MIKVLGAANAADWIGAGRVGAAGRVAAAAAAAAIGRMSIRWPTTRNSIN
jgi:hypothetical protein